MEKSLTTKPIRAAGLATSPPKISSLCEHCHKAKWNQNCIVGGEKKLHHLCPACFTAWYELRDKLLHDTLKKFTT